MLPNYYQPYSDRKVLCHAKSPPWLVPPIKRPRSLFMVTVITACLFYTLNLVAVQSFVGRSRFSDMLRPAQAADVCQNRLTSVSADLTFS
jgi:hypothetical protein